MLGLALLVGSIALADSLNPSTLIPGLWLASTRSAGKLSSYTLGVFAMYLAGGVVLVFGPGPALIATFHRVGGPVEHGLEAAGGLIALGLAFAAWRCRRKSNRPHTQRFHTRASAFTLGAGIMAIELPTAFMYFGAISAILAARPAAPVEVLLLATYNMLFVAPLAALITIQHVAGVRGERWITSAEARLRYVGQLALTGVATAAGGALLAVGLSGLLSS
jgi:cytochrome c biogenesis protein CcdA